MTTNDAERRRLQHEARGGYPCDHILTEVEDDSYTLQPTGNIVCVSCGKSAPREEF